MLVLGLAVLARGLSPSPLAAAAKPQRLHPNAASLQLAISIPRALRSCRACGGTRLILIAALVAGCGQDESEADRFEGEQRREVLRALIAEVKDPATAPALVRLFEHPDAGVRYAAAAKHWELTRAEEPGLRLLVDGVLRGDEAAVRALSPGRYPEAFVARLMEKPPRLRCVEALGAIEAASAKPMLLEIIAGPDAPGSGLRAEAAWSLYRIDAAQARRALGVLLPAYRAGNVFVRGRLAARIAAIAKDEPDFVRKSIDGMRASDDDDVRAAGEYLREQVTPR
jgi:HEAT repeat protein